MQSKAIRSYFRVPGTEKYCPSSRESNRSWSKSRCAKCGIGYCFSLKVKWGYISAQKPESERSKSFAVFFDWKTRPSGVSLASLGLENIPQVPVNRAEVGQNHDAPKALSATLSVLKSSGAIFLSRSSKVSVQKVLLCPFDFKTRPSGLSLASKGQQNIPQVPGNPFKGRQNYDARKAVSSTLSVLK